MDAEPKRLSGTVIRKPVAVGSKSERAAVVLRTSDNAEYILRRSGGNAFSDPELDKLVGSSITADGQVVASQTFIMKSWTLGGAAKP
ncbi:MAG: hypothetical protein Q7R45_16090 [Sulfuricaulis sp.]|nr:hypothetical protein [Sulfuricaulis sp.]